MNPATVPAGMPIVYLKAGCTDPAFNGDGWYGFDEAQQIHCGPFGHAVEAAFEMGKYAESLNHQIHDWPGFICLAKSDRKGWTGPGWYRVENGKLLNGPWQTFKEAEENNRFPGMPRRPRIKFGSDKAGEGPFTKGDILIDDEGGEMVISVCVRATGSGDGTWIDIDPGSSERVLKVIAGGIPNEKIISLCLRCIKVWGRSEIERVAIGEIGELLTLFGREVQNRAKHADWLDEISDVMLMAHQLACLHDPDAVAARMVEKMAKLEAKLVKAEAEANEKDRKARDSINRPWKAQ